MGGVGQLKGELNDDRGGVYSGYPAEQLRIALDQRLEPIMHGLQVGLDRRQILGVDAAQGLGLGIVEYGAQLGERRMGRVGVQGRRQARRGKVEAWIVVLDAERLQSLIVLDGID